jgi:hypothetical protein
VPFLRSVRESFLKTGWSLGLYTPPDRAMLDTILGHYAGSERYRHVLFVGVKVYNRHLPAMFAGKSFATMDPNPENARFGGDPHWVDVLEHLDRHAEADAFDLIVMNGVIGFGLDAPKNVESALVQVHRALRADGDLLLGINERIPTHVDLRSVEAMTLFRPKAFPPLGASRHQIVTPFREETHTFEFWEKAV